MPVTVPILLGSLRPLSLLKLEASIRATVEDLLLESVLICDARENIYHLFLLTVLRLTIECVSCSTLLLSCDLVTLYPRWRVDDPLYSATCVSPFVSVCMGCDPKCKNKFMTTQPGESLPFVEELLRQLHATVSDLETHQVRVGAVERCCLRPWVELSFLSSLMRGW